MKGGKKSKRESENFDLQEVKNQQEKVSVLISVRVRNHRTSKIERLSIRMDTEALFRLKNLFTRGLFYQFESPGGILLARGRPKMASASDIRSPDPSPPPPVSHSTKMVSYFKL